MEFIAAKGIGKTYIEPELSKDEKLKRIDLVIEALHGLHANKINNDYFVCNIYEELLGGRLEFRIGRSLMEEHIPEIWIIKSQGNSTFLTDTNETREFNTFNKIILLELLKLIIKDDCASITEEETEI